MKTLEENKDSQSYGFSSNFFMHVEQDVRVEKIVVFYFPLLASQKCSSYIQRQNKIQLHTIHLGARKQYLPKLY
jgi:hypothetical protein